MADISILVDYSDVQKANREILGIGTNAEKSARVFERAFSRAENASKRHINQVKQGAAAEARINKQREAALAKEAALVERLAQKHKPLYAASKLYSKTLDEINQAHKLGILNTQQHEAALERLNAEYTAFGNGTANSLNMFNQGLSRSNRGISHMSVLTQQAGYQVGDFIVQVQSGTNAFVAFGQQATQVAGTLTLLGGPWIAIGTALGIAIPLLTAAGAILTRVDRESEKAKSSLMDLSQVQQELARRTQEANLELEKQSKGLSNLGEAFLSTKIEEARKELSKFMSEIDKEIALATDEAVGRASGVGSAYSEETIRSVAQNIRDYILRERSTELEKLQETYNELVAIRGVEEGRARVQERNNLYIEEMSNLFRESKEILADIEAGYQEVASSQTTLNQEVTSYIEEMAKAFENTQSLRKELGDAAYEALRLAGVDLTKPLNPAIKEAAKLSDRLGVSLETAYTLNNTDMSAGIFKASEAAMTLARNLQISLRVALAMQGMIKEGPGFKGDAFDPRESSEDSPEQANARRLARLKAMMESGELFTSNLPISGGGSGGGGSRKSGGSKSGGGGTPKETAEDYLKTLTEEMSRKKELIGLFGEERSIRERVLDLQKRAQDKDLEISEAKLTAIALQEQALEKSLQRQEDLYNKFSNQVENSLMGLVDGSETVGDAFRNLVRTMILEMYREQVAKPVAQSAGGFISKLFTGGLFADGGVFQGGAQITAFANGGVVSGPTTFPMNNGMGLMGEAGPEAIMPLKRGTNGKLGVETSGNQQPINMTFNISTPDVRGFERSKTQIAASMQRTLQQGQRNQ